MFEILNSTTATQTSVSSLACVILLFMFYIKKNKYGFSPKEFDETIKNIDFKNKYNVKKFKKYLNCANWISAFGIILLIVSYPILTTVGFDSNIEIVNYHYLDGGELTFYSNSYWTVENAFIGNNNFSYKLDFLGIFCLCTSLPGIVLSCIGFYFVWKITDINFWKDEFFFEEYENKYHALEDKKIKTYRTVLLSTFAITILTLFIGVMLPLEKPDLEYWIVNFNKEVEGDSYGFVIYWTEIASAVLSIISMVSLIIYFVINYKISDLTLTRYQETMIRMFRNGSSLGNEPNNSIQEKYVSKSKEKDNSKAKENFEKDEW